MKFAPKFHGFPTKDNCNADDPYQAFLWMLVALPGQNGGQLVMPVDYLQLISERLWLCGARPVEAPTIKYRPPTGTDPNWITSPGTWVDVNAEDPQPNPARQALNALTAQQKAELLAELEKERDDPA